MTFLQAIDLTGAYIIHVLWWDLSNVPTITTSLMIPRICKQSIVENWNIRTIATLRVLSGPSVLNYQVAQWYCNSCGVCVCLYIECLKVNAHLWENYGCFHFHNILIDTVMNLCSILVQKSLNVMQGSDRQFWIGLCSMVSLIMYVLPTILESEVQLKSRIRQGTYLMVQGVPSFRYK